MLFSTFKRSKKKRDAFHKVAKKNSKSISKSHYNGMKNTHRNKLRMSIMDKMNFLKNKAMMEFKELEAHQFLMKR